MWGNGPSILGQKLPQGYLGGECPGDRVAILGSRIKGSWVGNPVDATGRILQFLGDCLDHTVHIVVVLFGVNGGLGFANFTIAGPEKPCVPLVDAVVQDCSEIRIVATGRKSDKLRVVHFRDLLIPDVRSEGP